MRLFLAIWPDQYAVSLIGALDRPARPGVRWTPSGHWHVTLRFLGEADLDECRSALAGTAWPAVGTAVVGPATVLLNPTVLAVPVSGLDELARVAAASTAGLGASEADPRRFRGHLTLARGRRPGDLEGLSGRTLSARLRARAVTLVSSRTAPLGPGEPVAPAGSGRYEVIASWPLAEV